MVQKIDNQTSRHLSADELMGILEAVKIIEKALKKTVYQLKIVPNSQSASDIWGIALSFDLTKEGWK